MTLVIAACVLLLSATPASAAPEPCAAGYVRLTFDDGPNRKATSAILDTLAAHGATATFFVVGSMVAASPRVVRRASREGHGIGNHSWSHPDLTMLSRDQVKAQLARTTKAIDQATGTGPTEWRPPYGATNPDVEEAARAVGLTTMVLWTVDPRDWEDPPATAVRDRVLQDVRPNSTVLLHDGSGTNTPEALPMILDGLAERGYCTR
jgi:peptidoglycan-N-acetylglucosamine deacetylase